MYGFDASGNSGLFSFTSTNRIVRNRNVSKDAGVPWSLATSTSSYLDEKKIRQILTKKLKQNFTLIVIFDLVVVSFLILLNIRR